MGVCVNRLGRRPVAPKVASGLQGRGYLRGRTGVTDSEIRNAFNRSMNDSRSG